MLYNDTQNWINNILKLVVSNMTAFKKVIDYA